MNHDMMVAVAWCGTSTKLAGLIGHGEELE
jgi:hypothetical protein